MSVDEKVSDQLERWSHSHELKTLGSLVEFFGEKSFALLFIVLLGVPALPLPTGGVSHAFEAIAMLLALELIAGRRCVWLPARARRMALSDRLANALVRRIRGLERLSRPRLPRLLSTRVSRFVFGVLVFVLSLVAFVAPPFTGLDTLPALGVVILAIGVLLGDSLLAVAGILVGAAGTVLVIGLGTIVVRALGDLL